MKKILITGCMGQLGRAIQKEYGSTVEFIKTDGRRRGSYKTRYIKA